MTNQRMRSRHTSLSVVHSALSCVASHQCCSLPFSARTEPFRRNFSAHKDVPNQIIVQFRFKDNISWVRTYLFQYDFMRRLRRCTCILVSQEFTRESNGSGVCLVLFCHVSQLSHRAARDEKLYFATKKITYHVFEIIISARQPRRYTYDTASTIIRRYTARTSFEPLNVRNSHP